MGATSATTDRPALTAADCAAALEALRERPPLVQSLTNIVAAQWTANVLLAVGAAPAMVDNPREAAAFAADRRRECWSTWARRTTTRPSPWSRRWPRPTDTRHPVGARPRWPPAPCSGGPTVALRPARARPSGRHPRQRLGDPGPDRQRRRQGRRLRAHPGGRPGRNARATGAEHRTVVAVSGPVDHLTDGERVVRVHNGHPWLTQVTGVGCALGALVAAFAAVVPDPLLAATAATTTLTVAAESAAATSRGPGSFAVALLDDLAALSPRGWATPPG